MADSLILTLMVGSVLGFLAGLGVGGGSLLLLWLTTVLEMSPADARIINLLFFLPAAAISCRLRIKTDAFPLHSVLWAIAAGCAAAILFTLLGRSLDTALLKKGFGVLLMITGIRELFFQSRNQRK